MKFSALLASMSHIMKGILDGMLQSGVPEIAHAAVLGVVAFNSFGYLALANIIHTTDYTGVKFYLNGADNPHYKYTGRSKPTQQQASGRSQTSQTKRKAMEYVQQRP